MVLTKYCVRYRYIIQIGIFVLAFLLGLFLHDPIYNIRTDHFNETSEVEPEEEVEGLLMDDGTYTGEIKNGKRQGWGKLTTVNGNLYEGEWFQNHLSYGILHFWDNSTKTFSKIWEGPFNAKLAPNGFGKMDYIDSIYIGNYVNSYRSGFGRIITKDGRQYFGQWERGRIKDSETNFHVGDSVYGIDLSHYQNEAGRIDWDNLALYCNGAGQVYPSMPPSKDFFQPVDFVFIQATKCLTQDKYYYDNMMEARRHFIKVGSYHILRLDHSITKQAEAFLNYMKRDAHDLPPVLDLESQILYANKAELSLSDDSIKHAILQWLKDIEEKTGSIPIIYSNQNFARDYIVNDPLFDRYVLWIARYANEEHKKIAPSEDIRWTFWQFASEKTKAKAHGINGYIDINKFQGSYRDFIRLYP